MKGEVPVRPDSQYLSIPEAAAEAHMSVRGFYRLLQQKKGPTLCRLSPRKAVIRREDFDAWVKAQSTPRKRNRSSNPNGAVPAPPAS